MTDETALLAVICARRDEDAPRLIYADWLDDYDQSERAEFIRVQCEIARLAPPVLRPRRFTPTIAYSVHSRTTEMVVEGAFMPPDDAIVDVLHDGYLILGAVISDIDVTVPVDGPIITIMTIRYGTDAFAERTKLEWLRGRERELWPSKPSDFAAWFSDWLPGAVISRGFISSVTCTAADWLAHADALYWHPEQTVRCPVKFGRVVTITREMIAGEMDFGPVNQSHPATCPSCSGSGRIPRPFPSTAQPLAKVRLTTDIRRDIEQDNNSVRFTNREWRSKASLGLRLGSDILPTLFAAEWPGLEVELPATHDLITGRIVSADPANRRHAWTARRPR